MTPLTIILAIAVVLLTGLRIAQEYQRGVVFRLGRYVAVRGPAELEASRKLADAAQQMANNPVAVELRRMQMVTEVGAENNSTTVLMIPSDFVSLSKSLGDYLRERTARDTPS